MLYAIKRCYGSGWVRGEGGWEGGFALGSNTLCPLLKVNVLWELSVLSQNKKKIVSGMGEVLTH